MGNIYLHGNFINMVKFGYRAVEERYPPSQLLTFAALAEKQGFEFVCISDHFLPWFHRDGHSGHAWIWIAAAGAKTKRVRLGTGVTTCIYRYHPAIVAQAFASLDELYPGRIFLGMGTGEAMNEEPIGLNWPSFDERLERTVEAVQIIKLLWEKDFVEFKGKHYNLRKTNLYTKPVKKIPVYFAASGTKASRAAGRFGDALMTTDFDREHVLRIFASFEEGVKESGRRVEDMPRMVEMKVSYDEDYDKALNSLSVWKATTIPAIFSRPISDPRELDKMGETVDPARLAGKVYTDMEHLIRKIEEYIELGFNEIQVGSSSPDEEKFIRKFGKKALPYLQEKYSSV
jgi:coenzyme F420-dependent glucose-6-phosphate dehydrogenase